MKIRVAKRLLCGQVIVFFSCSIMLLAGGISDASGAEPTGLAALLVRGGTQAVLAVGLIAVSMVFMFTLKLLLRAYKDRIAAMEEQSARSVHLAVAQQDLAGALRELREGQTASLHELAEHCKEMHAIRPK